MAKTLYLLRHAKSSWDAPELSDHDRPLAPRGRRAARMMAEHLRVEHIAPDVVLCSSSVRTRETLDAIRQGFAAEVRIEIEPGLYGATVDELLARLRAVGEDVESAMLIGHLPAIQELSVSLPIGSASLEDVRRKFPTGALATLKFAGGWGGLAAEAAEFVAFVRPRDLEPPAGGDPR